MAINASSKVVPLSCNELSDSVLEHGEAAALNPAFSEVHRQESGIFDISDLSDTSNCFSDNDIEWDSCDEDDGAIVENNHLWEQFQQCTFWSPMCSIKQSCCPLQRDSQVVEDETLMDKLPSRCKRVTFKPDKELVTIHHMIAWDYAYRACRHGPWENMAQDRARFSRRIEELSTILEPCLKKLVNRMTASNNQ